MIYTPMKKDDFDKSFKYEKQTFLCYSGKKLREITKDKECRIVGLARKTKKESNDKLVLGKNRMSVFDPEKDKNELLYKSIGFIPVRDNEYVAVQENRVPFLAGLGTMAAVTAVVCIMMYGSTTIGVDPDGKPFLHVSPSGFPISEQDPQFNPLPPVDENVEDADNTASPMNNERDPHEEGGGAVTINYIPKASLDLTKGQITMEYQNPATSSHDAVIEMYIAAGGKEYKIATSGRIPAGKKLQTMQLSVDKKLFAGEGNYNAMYRIIYYDPDTGEKALAGAAIDDIVLTAKKG